MIIDPPPSLLPLVKDNPNADMIWKKWLNGLRDSLAVEDWHYIGETDEPAFENSWVNFDSNRPARFYKDPFGRVHLDGMIKTGAIGTTAFTLPEGFRADHIGATIHIGAASNDSYGELLINTIGEVHPAVGSSVWFSLSGISFRAS